MDIVEENIMLELKENKNALQQCMHSKNMQTCMECDEVLECKLRNEYIKSVYKSMNKGQSMDFDF